MFTENNECYDTLITLENGTKIIGEIKVRNFATTAYPDYILEVDKLVNIIKRKQTIDYDLIYYINFFHNQDKEVLKDFIVFNLSKRIEAWKIKPADVQYKWMNACTRLSTTQKVKKEVIMLAYDSEIDWQGTITLKK
jgi:hypothetical protein